MTTHWTLGVLIGLPIAALITLVCLALIAWGVSIRIRKDSSDWSFNSWFAITLGALALGAVLAGTGFSLWPWDARFHQWRPVTGVVEQTNTRLIADGKAVSQRIVLRIAGKPYGCDDTRCTLLQPGDRVALTCKPEYQYAGAAGEGCEFIGSTRTGDMP